MAALDSAEDRRSGEESPVVGQFRFRCALCAGGTARLVLSKQGMQLWRCAACALVQRHPMPGEDEVRAMYAAEAHYSEECLRGLEAFLARDRALVAELLERGGAGPLLDVGAGAGIMLRAAREAGLEATGLEYSAPSAERARASSGARVVETRIEEVPLPLGSQGLVVFSHSLEHLRDPLGGLRRAAELLRPGGLVHVAVPNWAAAKRVVAGAHCPWVYPHHLVYFRRDTLRRALRQAGLEPVHIESRPFLGDDWRFVLAVLRRCRLDSAARRFLRMGARPLEELIGDDVRVAAPAWRFRFLLAVGRTILRAWPERLLARVGRAEELRVTARRA